jgi:hypothetical protein
MIMTRLAIAAIVAAGLASVPLTAEAKTYEQLRQYVSMTQSDSNAMSELPTTQSSTYGTSGTTVGTVTAPSVGSYYWPSVGVTNAVPTWSNTGPGVRR